MNMWIQSKITAKKELGEQKEETKYGQNKRRQAWQMSF